MKPSSLAEVCSIKSKKHKKPRFQPLPARFSFPLRDAATIRTRPTKQHSCEKQRARTSRQLRSRAWPFFTLCILRRRFNYRAAPRQDDELTTSYLSEQPAIYQPRPVKGQEKKLPHKQQPPIQQQGKKNPTKITQKPALNSVTQSVFLCYPGARRSHDKNKLRDKNIAWGR